jgi:four helix bundle protein
MSFEQINAWQKSKLLAVGIYKILKNCNDYSFKDQLQRSAVSVMSNMPKVTSEMVTKSSETSYTYQKAHELK